MGNPQRILVWTLQPLQKMLQKTWVRQERVEEQILPYFDKITIKDQKLAEWIKKALLHPL